MVKKTITFTDYNGNERTEDHYFNLNAAELTEWEMSIKGGLSSVVDRITKTNDVPALASIFKELIMKAYGVKSDDGRKFIKNQEVLNDFMQTEAYSTLYMELAQNDKAAIEFINGIIPNDLEKKLKQNNESNAPAIASVK